MAEKCAAGEEVAIMFARNLEGISLRSIPGGSGLAPPSRQPPTPLVRGSSDLLANGGSSGDANNNRTDGFRRARPSNLPVTNSLGRSAFSQDGDQPRAYVSILSFHAFIDFFF